MQLINLNEHPVQFKNYTSVFFKNNKVYIRGLDVNDNRVSGYTDFQPTVWVPYEFNLQHWKQHIINQDFNSWTTFLGNKPINAVTFDSIESCKKFVAENITIKRDNDGKPVKETKVHTSPNNMFINEYIAKMFPTDIPIEMDKLKIYAYDIETEIGHRDVDDLSIVKVRTKQIDNDDSFEKVKFQQKEMTIEQFELMPDNDKWELYDQNTDQWVDYKDHPYRYIGGFPDPEQANEKITLITVQDVNTKQIWTWGLENFVNPKPDEIEYRQFENEVDMMKNFVEFIDKDHPDVMTGWNCLNKNSSVWFDDHIDTIENVNQNDRLVDSTVLMKSIKSLKDEYQLDLYGRSQISCSKDHIFPCYVIDNEKYTNFVPRYTNTVDLSVSDIIHNMSENRSVYLKLPIHQNSNPNLNLRTIIEDNVDWYFDTYEFFGSDNVKIENVDELKRYVQNNDKIIVQFNSQVKKSFNLNYELTKEFCHLLGLIYTDGSYDVKGNMFVYYSSLRYMIDKVDEYVYENFVNKNRAKKYKIHTPTKNNYGTRIGVNNLFGFVAKSLIYNSNKKKSINKKTISRMSSDQFFDFFSGLVDGDGHLDKCKLKNGQYRSLVNLCNYDGDIQNIKELLLWNGIFANSYEHGINIESISGKDIKSKLDLWIDYKQKLVSFISCCNKDSKAKAKHLDIRKVDDFFVIKIKNAFKTDKKVEMYDIMTDTHYFYTQGIKTHNCSFFDNTYVGNRVKKILGTDWMNRLSPFGDIHFKKVEANEFGNTITETSWSGIAPLDYLKLYKKFVPGNKESYKLDAIAEIELGRRKVQNPTGGGFKDFYTGKFEVKDPPNQDDHEIKKLGYQRSLLKAKLFDHPKLKPEYDALNEKIIKMCKQLFIEYNIQDVRLVAELDDKLQFLNLIYTIGYMSHCNPEDVFGPVKTWDISLYYMLYHQHKVIPIKLNASKSEKYPGAYVKSPLVGRHQFCESFDLDSLLNG